VYSAAPMRAAAACLLTISRYIGRVLGEFEVELVGRSARPTDNSRIW
jgi:hypothetical protein